MSLHSAPLFARRVLLADDDPLVRTVYADILRGAGCDVVEARGGDEAVTLAGTLQPDLVLMDLSMPGMDGWDALAALRADPRTRGLAVVALTATEGAVARARAATAGFDGFIVKPFTPGALLRDVAAACEGAAAAPPRPPAESRLATAARAG